MCKLIYIYTFKDILIFLKMKSLNGRSKKEFQKEFDNIKRKEKISLSDLEYLINIEDTNVDFIEFFLNYLKTNKLHRKFIQNIIYLFPIIPKDIGQKYNIIKKLSEKERFYEIFSRICDAEDEKEIQSIIDEQYKFPKELCKLSLNQEEKSKLNRWDITYNQIVDFKNIENEEYIYYSISNYLISNFQKDKSINKKNYQTSLRQYRNILMDIKELKIEKTDLFEYIILLILNSEISDSFSLIQNKNLYNKFYDSISFTLKKEKLLTIDEMKNEFLKKKFIMEIKDNDIILKYKSYKSLFYIRNYSKYNITKAFIEFFCYYNNINENILSVKFDYLINPKIYFNGLLYKIIEKYVTSNLCYTAINKCFNLDKFNHELIDKEIFTNNIHRYIRYIPYNSKNDTGRTMRKFCKILIDPSKQKMATNIINSICFQNENLYKYLEQFINIVYRKYTFEHEHNHLCNSLLFFLYTNSSDGVNTPPKEIRNNKICSPKIDVSKIQNDDSNTIKNYIYTYMDQNEEIKIVFESGILFENIVYGKVHHFFTFKQLLFIANEKNDDLSVNEYTTKFIEISKDKNNTEKLLNEFPNGLILSDLVNKIYIELKNVIALPCNKNKNLTINQLLDGKFICYKDNNNIQLNSINDIDEIIITEQRGHYDCHVDGNYYHYYTGK